MNKQAIDILDEMIHDAEKAMYPEKGQLDMKEFNIFSCWKASLEIAKSRIQALGDGWIPAITNPKLPANLIVKSYVYPTLVVEVNTLEEFHNMLPSIYMYLPPTK